MLENWLVCLTWKQLLRIRSIWCSFSSFECSKSFLRSSHPVGLKPSAHEDHVIKPPCGQNLQKSDLIFLLLFSKPHILQAQGNTSLKRRGEAQCDQRLQMNFCSFSVFLDILMKDRQKADWCFQHPESRDFIKILAPKQFNWIYIFVRYKLARQCWNSSR